ncbi:MAG: FAD-dependent oxidoreductase, partial [Gammaproteobacteria bacterium]
AMAMADNPMVPATGHRICNDCMKACVYQKQDPVDIPQAETRILTDVLDLPWGVEIYDLLTRWNPLRSEGWVMRSFNGRKVLVAGMGPAGFTMAHYLTLEGCAVVGIDGLKIEPLPEELIRGPIHDIDQLREALDDRILAGFGGVAEYGITVRWDKNFLRLIYLSLLRRPGFQVFGGVRLGGTVTVEDAWELGFDHLCIATGAGEPKVIPVGNSLARGMRQANDFLMALQLTGAAKRGSLANLQVRLPAVVIGGGLTAIDTATEIQAYYIVQVERTLERHETLVAERGEDPVFAALDPESKEILEEFLAHGRAVREERARAAATGEAPDFISLVREWGGVTIAYRRSLNESPAYLRNHEEVIKAMEEGIYYAEAVDPRRALLDRFKHVEAMEFRRRNRSPDGRWLETYSKVTLPARSVMVAAGASPNTIYEEEHPGTFILDGNHFRPHVHHQDALQPVQVAAHVKANEFGPLTSYGDGRHRVTFLGDTHPVFHGSVVKAIASSKRSYPTVLRSMEALGAPDPDRLAYAAFRARMDHLFRARVVSVDDSHPAVIEMWVRAPMAARNFRPGQFFRLQSFESLSPRVDGTTVQVPVATVSGAGVEGDKLRLMLLRWGANPEIAARLSPGTPLVLMGPTGAPAPVGRDRTVMVIAGAWGGAVMLDLGRAWRAAGNRVLFFAAYPSRDALFNKEELEACADQIVWCTASGEAIAAERPQDASVAGSDMVTILKDYAEGRIVAAEGAIALKEVDEVMVMGSTGLLKAMQSAMKGELRPAFKADVDVTGTVGSPMQCMMKGVCAQCLQWQLDPETGERTRAVFSCAHQDQPLHWIDVDNLAARQGQNRLSEVINTQWAKRALGGDGG